MAIDVTEATFDRDVIELSRQTPVVVDFWAEWCGPCRTLGPALEAAEASRGGRVLLAKVDVDANQGLSARFGIQGIPAVKAFRDGEVVDEFVGAVPKAKVEALFDSLVPSRADELLAAGDELSLREASELEPRRADIAVALAGKRLERGAEDDALSAVEGHQGDFAAEGISARIGLTKAGLATRPSKRSTVATAPPPSTHCSTPSRAPMRTPVSNFAAPPSASSANSIPATRRRSATVAASPLPLGTKRLCSTKEG
jgi:putative thioredoxin